MITNFTEDSYAFPAQSLARIRQAINQLAAERALVISRFSEKNDAVRNELLTAIDDKLAALNQSAEGFSHLLENKLAEDTTEKLGLGKVPSFV